MSWFWIHVFVSCLVVSLFWVSLLLFPLSVVLLPPCSVLCAPPPHYLPWPPLSLSLSLSLSLCPFIVSVCLCCICSCLYLRLSMPLVHACSCSCSCFCQFQVPFWYVLVLSFPCLICTLPFSLFFFFFFVFCFVFFCYFAFCPLWLFCTWLPGFCIQLLIKLAFVFSLSCPLVWVTAFGSTFHFHSFPFIPGVMDGCFSNFLLKLVSW